MAEGNLWYFGIQDIMRKNDFVFFVFNLRLIIKSRSEQIIINSP